MVIQSVQGPDPAILSFLAVGKVSAVPGLEVELPSSAPLTIAGGNQIRMRVRPGELPEGTFQAFVEVQTDLPDHARLQIPVTGTVRNGQK